MATADNSAILTCRQSQLHSRAQWVQFSHHGRTPKRTVRRAPSRCAIATAPRNKNVSNLGMGKTGPQFAIQDNRLKKACRSHHTVAAHLFVPFVQLMEAMSPEPMGIDSPDRDERDKGKAAHSGKMAIQRNFPSRSSRPRVANGECFHRVLRPNVCPPAMRVTPAPMVTNGITTSIRKKPFDWRRQPGAPVRRGPDQITNRENRAARRQPTRAQGHFQPARIGPLSTRNPKQEKCYQPFPAQQTRRRPQRRIQVGLLGVEIFRSDIIGIALWPTAMRTTTSLTRSRIAIAPSG